MESFKKHSGIVALLDLANVDTDQIIPKQFLKSIKRTGFGKDLFFDWRYLPDGEPNPKFSLNAPEFKNASILVARNNFGSGSSREHAVWAIKQYGFQVVIAPWKQNQDMKIPAFADIFRNNGFKNALLTIDLSEPEVEKIFQAISKQKGAPATVDLERQSLILHTSPGQSFSFQIDSSNKKRLMEGLDDIGLTLRQEALIAAFEARHNVQFTK